MREYIPVLPYAQSSFSPVTMSFLRCESPWWEGKLRGWSVSQGPLNKTMHIVLLWAAFLPHSPPYMWLIAVCGDFAEA